MTKNEMPRHSTRVGGSSAGLRRLCNASLIEAKKVPHDHNIYAARGTCLHTIMEAAIKDDLSDDEIYKRYSGARYADLLHDPDEIEAYGHYEITEDEITDKIMPALAFFDCELAHAKSTLTEERVDFEPWVKLGKDHPFESDFAIEGAFGTSDVIFVGEDAGVVDWKFGENNIVDPENNDQMRFYLAAAIHSGVLPVQDEYVAWIFQPAYKLDEANYARSAVYTLNDLTDFALDLKDAMESDPEYNPGSHCENCKGKLVCAAYNDMISTVETTDIEGLSNTELAEQLARIPALKNYIKEVTTAALRNAQNGVPIPGYGLVMGEGNSAWKDEQAAWGALARMGLSAAERTVKGTISPTQALKLIHDKGVKSDKEIEKFKKRHIVRPKTAEKLMPIKPGEDANDFERLASALKPNFGKHTKTQVRDRAA